MLQDPPGLVLAMGCAGHLGWGPGPGGWNGLWLALPGALGVAFSYLAEDLSVHGGHSPEDSGGPVLHTKMMGDPPCDSSHAVLSLCVK